MFWCILLTLLYISLKEVGINTEQKIIVNNFYDYWFQLNNTNDHLIIELPKNSLLFISSLLGYEAVIYDIGIVGYDPLPKKMIPNPKDRLVYFKDNGYVNVTSTIDNLNFTFHTLCLDKIDVPYDQLIISTNPYEKFDLYYKNSNFPFSHTGNSTFKLSHLIWQIGDNFTRCEIVPLVHSYSNHFYPAAEKYIHPCYFSFPFHNTSDKSQIKFTHIKLMFTDIGQYMISNSKLVYFEKVMSMSIDDPSYIYYKCKPQDVEYNYYTGYRAAFNVSEFKKTGIISRGSYRINFTKIIESNDFKDGIAEIDLSVNNKIEFNSNFNIVIFPTTSQIRFNSYINDSLLGIIQCYDGIVFETGSLNHIDDSVINMNAIIYSTYNLKREEYYIISTSPTEYLKIDYTHESNYSVRRKHVYIMASLQNITTTVTFDGDLKFELLKYGKVEEIQPNTSNTITISGPFVAHIPMESTCEFITTPNEELKKGFVDDGLAYFRNKYEDSGYISKKYGFYKNYTLFSVEINISFNSAKYCLVKTAPMVYSQDTHYWSGEILYPPLKDNLVGTYDNRRSFYVSGSDQGFIYVMYQKSDINFEEDVLHLRTAPFELLKGHDAEDNMVNCTRMIVFNEFPSKFGINQKPNNGYRRIDINTNEIVCMFPAASYFYFGTTAAQYFSNNINKWVGYVYNEWNPANLLIGRPYQREDTYCKNVSSYYLHGLQGYSIVRFRTKYPHFKAVASYIYIENPTHKYNYTYLGILPDEPMFYSDFKINKTYGVHSFGENVYEPIEGGDEDEDDDNSNDNNIKDDIIEITCNNANSHEIINMEKIKRIIIKCPKSTLFFIHYIAGYRAEIYESSSIKIIKTITEDDEYKIVNFGKSDGTIIIEEEPLRKFSLLNDYKDEFSYSYIVLDKAFSKDEKNKCDKIFITSKLISSFSIKESETDSDSDSADCNYTISNESSFCLWFSFPFLSKVRSDVYLSYIQSVLIDDNLETLEYETNEKNGYNLLYVLKKSSLSSKSYDKTANYYASFNTGENYGIFMHYKQINNVFGIDSKTSILIPNDLMNTVEKKEPKENKKKFNVFPFVLSLAALVVIIVIIIIVVACVKKSKKQVSNEGSASQNELDSMPNQSNPYQNNIGQNNYNQNNQYQNNYNQNYPAQSNYSNYQNSTYQNSTNYQYNPYQNSACQNCTNYQYNPYQNSTNQNSFNPNNNCED